MSTLSFHPAAFALQAMFALANETERQLARNLGLNLTDYRALSVLAQLGPVTVGELAGQLGATPATTTAIVNRLVSHGFVARHRGTDDRRHVHVSATAEAAREIATLMQPLISATNEHIQALPASEQSVVADFLDVAQHLMRGHLDTLSTKDAP